MDNKSKKVLSSALNGLIKRLEKTEKFALEQAPDICKQMVYEKTLEKTIELWTSLPAAIALVIATIILAFKSHSALESEPSGGLAFLCGALSLAACVGSFVFLESVRYAVNWLIYLKKCPKLFLLREFRDLLKG